MQTLTDTQRARTEQALSETYALLNKELGYLPHLRNQSNIDFYISHIEKLKKILN